MTTEPRIPSGIKLEDMLPVFGGPDAAEAPDQAWCPGCGYGVLALSDQRHSPAKLLRADRMDAESSVAGELLGPGEPLASAVAAPGAGGLLEYKGVRAIAVEESSELVEEDRYVALDLSAAPVDETLGSLEYRESETWGHQLDGDDPVYSSHGTKCGSGSATSA